ncbi:MAG: AAA family ATPase [Lachnospiraceae bacterium]|nr:AAA family ATPase [Lachnospiraceae bacterium]
MGAYLNPGNNLFQMDANSQIYIDKTELIKHTNRLIGSQQRFICVSRPRRFGKSIAANMLAAYYGKGCDSSELFDRFKIAGQVDYKKHLNQYNVIALNIQNFFGLMPNVDDALKYLQKRVLKELKSAYPGLVDEDEIFLSIALEDVYSKTQQPFVFIIDEWDCILRDRTYTDDDHKKYLDFVRNLLKDRAYVALAYMTGILPIKKYGTHSALNMFTEFSMTNSGSFAEYIGFTEKEVLGLCREYNVDFELMKNWYDGYIFPGDLHIYNPKSVVDSLLRKNFSSYWTQTETYEALKRYIELNYDGLKDAVTQMLAGELVHIDTETFQNDMTTFRNRDDVLTLLIHLGYLAFEQESRSVFIPNSEVAAEFVRSVKSCKWEEVNLALANSDKLLQATWNMDEKEVAAMIDSVHQENTSILTYNDENALSCVIALAYYNARNEYIRIRELPAGKGFADLVFIPKRYSDKPALVIELKYDKTARAAIDQIKDKNYVEALKEYHGNLLLVGINYNKATKKHECLMEKLQIV